MTHGPAVAEDLSVPDLVEFDPGNDALFTVQRDDVSESKSAEESVDELQALNTALCFLCSINADVSEVESFLTLHPDALLLEGAGNLPEESARYIVEQQMRRCKCFSPGCNQNRVNVLDALSRGFEYYQGRRLSTMCQTSRQQLMGSSEPHHRRWGLYRDRLLTVERDVRKLRMEELIMRSRLVEMAVELKSFQEELDLVQRRHGDGGGCHHHHGSSSNGSSSASSKSVALFSSILSSCTRKNDLFARVSVLEYQVGVASINLSSVEREHKLLLREIRDGRRVQFGLLKSSFDGVRRHVCVVARIDPAAAATTSAVATANRRKKASAVTATTASATATATTPAPSATRPSTRNPVRFAI